jgi:hypothetical protein
VHAPGFFLAIVQAEERTGVAPASLYWPNRCFIRGGTRPEGGLSIGRPRSGGMIVRVPCDWTPQWTHSVPPGLVHFLNFKGDQVV